MSVGHPGTSFGLLVAFWRPSFFDQKNNTKKTQKIKNWANYAPKTDPESRISPIPNSLLLRHVENLDFGRRYNELTWFCGSKGVPKVIKKRHKFNTRKKYAKKQLNVRKNAFRGYFFPPVWGSKSSWNLCFFDPRPLWGPKVPQDPKMTPKWSQHDPIMAPK